MSSPETHRYSLAAFFVLAFAISYGFFALSANLPGFPALFPFGPLLAALIVAGATRTLRDFFGRCLRWRVPVRWYAAALLVPAAIGLAAVCLDILLGAPVPTFAQRGPWYTPFVLFPAALIDAPLQEESGWRGFAVPRFPARLSPLANSLILGLILAGWHAPLILSEPSLVAPYLLATFASAVVTNWLFYSARGSALLAILYHTSANTVGLYFRPLFAPADFERYLWLLAAANAAVAITLALVTGPTLQGRKTRAATSGQA